MLQQETRLLIPVRPATDTTTKSTKYKKTLKLAPLSYKPSRLFEEGVKNKIFQLIDVALILQLLLLQYNKRLLFSAELVATIWNMSFIWSMSFFRNMSHVFYSYQTFS